MLKIQENIPLAPYSSFKIGGPAKYFIEAQSVAELCEAVQYAADKNLDYFILGGGSNLLISDQGFSGLVIKVKLNGLYLDEQKQLITAEAGVYLAGVVNKSAQAGLTGMEWAAGIPGTLGGAVRGNARAFGKNMATVVESVEAFDSNDIKIKNFSNAECEFNYWGSLFKKNKNFIILSVKIKLAVGNKEKIQEEIKKIQDKRISGQPQGVGSAGSFFLNPVVTDEKLRREFEEEKGMKAKDDKLPAGWIIEKAGMQGKKIGGAMISEKHANFLVNTGSATAEDVIMLSSLVKQQVRDKFGIQLESEVSLLGF
jgi:UDP-N-acetylmuramate dehydrogenase